MGLIKGAREMISLKELGLFSIDQEELPLFSEQSEENESGSKTENGFEEERGWRAELLQEEGMRIEEEAVRMGRKDPVDREGTLCPDNLE